MTNIFYLDDLEIEEPVGFGEIELLIRRDDTFHGMSYEASTSSLQFYGAAADYLKEKKRLEGVRANVRFRAMSACETYDYEELISGRLNFGKFREVCGEICTVTLPIEQESCAITLHARKDLKVDVDKTTGVDNISVLGIYGGLNVETELPAHELFVGAEGYEDEAGETIDLAVFASVGPGFYAVRPTYTIELNASINQTQLIPTSNTGLGDSGADIAISPVVLLDDFIDCFEGGFEYEVRLKGSYNLIGTSPLFQGYIRTQVVYGEFADDLTTLHTDMIFGPATPGNINPNHAGVFDETYTGTVILPQGKGFYVYMETASRVLGHITFDPETYVRITGVKSCPATNAELNLIHETLSRVTESITNGCIRAKSSFYGRTDSEPFAFPADGCGGLRAVTSGLKIRRATEDKFFTSLKDLLEGLNAIDNIGFDIIPDPDYSFGALLRVEGVDFFYNNAEILRHDAIPRAETEVEEGKHYSRIQVGYKKWEVERVNGLDEFNSTREYNTSIDTINSNLDITSVLVAGSYPIEITRQQSFANTGGADTKFDNDTFIICLYRPDYPYGSLAVELGNITNPQNIFSPNTIYNYRISPLRNLMRWYKTIAAGLPDLSDPTNSLFFSSGTGNLIASGLMTDTFCRMENSEVQENDNIFVTKFSNSIDYTPLWKNEVISYDYPMSVADYRNIKANPYGYISAQCGSADFEKYWIKEIKYRPMKGTATITGRLKYGT